MEGPIAVTLLKVLVPGNLDPAPNLAERNEAALGLCQMNYKNMPEYDTVYGYPIALAAMVALDVALYLWFKKIRWL